MSSDSMAKLTRAHVSYAVPSTLEVHCLRKRKYRTSRFQVFIRSCPTTRPSIHSLNLFSNVAAISSFSKTSSANPESKTPEQMIQEILDQKERDGTIGSAGPKPPPPPQQPPPDLPPNWERHRDGASDHEYYFNSVTGVTQWEKPSDDIEDLEPLSSVLPATASASPTHGPARPTSPMSPRSSRLWGLLKSPFGGQQYYSLEGKRVELHKLTRRPEMNGRVGMVIGVDRMAGRYLVELEGLDHTNARTIKLRPGNVRKLDNAKTGVPPLLYNWCCMFCGATNRPEAEFCLDW